MTKEAMEEKEAAAEEAREEKAKEIDLKDLTEEEFKAHMARMKIIEESGYAFSKINVDELMGNSEPSCKLKSAEGTVTGTWDAIKPLSTFKDRGFRVDNSAYDPLTNTIYVVPYCGHLYKVEPDNNKKYTRLNHKVKCLKIFEGFHLADNTFRLIRSHQDAWDVGYMTYSDDEGRTWKKANGVSIINDWGFGSAIIDHNGTKKVVILAGGRENNTDITRAYVSNDFGVNYTKTNVSFTNNEYNFKFDAKSYFKGNVKLIKVHNSNDALLVTRNKNDTKQRFYLFNPNTDEFDLINTSSTANYAELWHVEATVINNAMHIYTLNNKNNFNYTADTGKTFTRTGTASFKTESIHPENKDMFFKGFVDINVSTNGGSSWTNFSHKLGWDFQHMRFYRKPDNTLFAVVGKDHGFFMSETPQNKDSYTYLNNKAQYGMHYDGITSEKYNYIFVANQDRGASAYKDGEEFPATVRTAPNDVLTVELTRDEKATWHRHYYGQVVHRWNNGYKTSEQQAGINKDYPDWSAPPIVASPIYGEDAV
ncbi:MAG: glycoside hydrolase, partial [Bacteroidales bacterium]|nr:glycoside hydrolase [Bacteroidales bacterium]